MGSNKEKEIAKTCKNGGSSSPNKSKVSEKSVSFLVDFKARNKEVGK